MGDNIGKIIYRTLPYNSASLTTLWHHVDPNPSIISRLLCKYMTTSPYGLWVVGHGSWVVGHWLWIVVGVILLSVWAQSKKQEGMKSSRKS